MSTIIFFSTLHEFVNAGEHKEKAVMQMPKGMEMKVLNIDDYKVTSHIMDMPAYHKLMKSMDMKHSEMEGDTSHHIMVEIAGKGGNKIEDAVVKIKVLDPRKEFREKLLKPMTGQVGQYGADFNMIYQGNHQIVILFKVAGEKHKGGYWYEKK